MTAQSDTRAEARIPLSRDRVLRTAIVLADAEGIDAVSMRRLGRELGVEAMSLYNHVTNKEDILRGMAEIVFSEIAPPPRDADWKTALRYTAISAHAVFGQHPWAHGITTSPDSVSPARLQWMEAVLRTLREAGFSAESACHAYHALDSHIIGFSLWRASIPPATELREMAVDFLQRVPLDNLPFVAEHIQQHTRPTGPSDVSAFEFGLDLILDGLERIRDAR